MRWPVLACIPAALGTVLATAGCGNPVNPAAAADTWVARTVDGQPLPVRVPVTLGEYLYEADTLVLQPDGRFIERTVTARAATGTPRSSVRECTGQYQLLGSRLTLAYGSEGGGQVVGCQGLRRSGFVSADRMVLSGVGDTEFTRR